MTQRQRKFAGAILLLASIAAYAALASAVHEHFVADKAMWVQLLYFLVAGLAWGVPAAFIITWMSRPDPDPDRQ